MISQQDVKSFSVLATEHKTKSFHLTLYKVERETISYVMCETSDKEVLPHTNT